MAVCIKSFVTHCLTAFVAYEHPGLSTDVFFSLVAVGVSASAIFFVLPNLMCVLFSIPTMRARYLLFKLTHLCARCAHELQGHKKAVVNQ